MFAITAAMLVAPIAACSSLAGQSSETAVAVNDAANRPDPKACKTHGLALQTLGTGGPIADDHRAGSANIVWVAGRAALLIDAGPGVFVRYGEAGVDAKEHEAVLLTHLHGDHVGGLAGLLNAWSFTGRSEKLLIAGPEGSAAFPSTSGFLQAMVGPQGGLRYLSPYLDGSAALPLIESKDLPVGGKALLPVIDRTSLSVAAIPVHHLDVPALAYVVRAGAKTIVFAGDQSFMSDGFVAALKAQQPDLLVMHNAISMAAGQPRGLHRDGRSIGEAAASLGAKRLVLTHNMQRALNDSDAIMAAIRENYAGPVDVADDLSCYPLLD
jgi:ribonuclease BN (tRNA processing enzyme)